VLEGTYVQTVTVKGLTVTLITWKKMKATVLNSKVGFFRHLILGTVSVHLDTPVTDLLVPRRLTSYSMDTIATKLTTCISGHALAGTLDGLLSKNYRLENLRQQWLSLL